MVNLISNPPYNMKWNPDMFESKSASRYGKAPKSNANFAFILKSLDKITGKAAFILPGSVLEPSTKDEKQVLKNLIDANLIDAAITLPGNMFEATTIGTCVLLLDKNKKDELVELVDLRNSATEEVRVQRGQFGGASHTSREYEKRINVLSEEVMIKAQNHISSRLSEVEFSKAVSLEDVKKNNYTLVPSKYIAFEMRENKHRPYSDIVNDINKVIRFRNNLKLTINESLAKRLGLFEVAELAKDSNKNSREMSITTKRVCGIEIAKSDYITLSKNKNEIKFENADKEKISEILLHILQSYKMHIAFLNNMENEYLIELRDALLPDLLEGKIDVSKIADEEDEDWLA